MNHRRNICRRQLESVRGIRMADIQTSSWLYKAGIKMWVIPLYLYYRSPPNRMWDTLAQVSGGGSAIPLRSDPTTINTRLECVAFFTAFITVVVPTLFPVINYSVIYLYTNIRFIRSGQGYTSPSSYTAGINGRSEMTSRYIITIHLNIFKLLSCGFYFIHFITRRQWVKNNMSYSLQSAAVTDINATIENISALCNSIII